MVAAAVLLTACGTSEPGADSEKDDKGGPVTVTDARGKEVKLKSPADRVVSLEWAETEMLVSLGVMPVGVAQSKEFGTWNTAVKLDKKVKDVGDRNEPSEDAISGLNPDLVITTSDRPDSTLKQLEKSVPVLVVKGSDAKSGNLKRMESDLDMIAEAVGRTDEADTLMEDFESKLAEGKKALGDAADTPFLMADGWDADGKISIRVHSTGSMYDEVATGLGLKNAWTKKVAYDKVWGLDTVDVEALSYLEDKKLKFMYDDSGKFGVFTKKLKGNKIWDSLTFVKDGETHKLPDGIWMFGGPKSGEQMIDAIVEVYTS
ncbi:periplasmic binding protein [Stackebrandtia nassauensis DSM 44728]|uniref:Periplasmic binding protein n=2 Tax=Stackebrandtia TaxID=283810 RepID=D3PYT9_STANL|nr:periplasmic binding protein [Stackebrandtia nassauensis DSM 44728]